jgi:metal-responsive CopG/Arc/MetJ family transcriptional regulator
VVSFFARLFMETERVAAETGATRSKLIRCAVEQDLEAVQRRRLWQELAAGYAANSALGRGIAEEFSAVDHEASRSSLRQQH